MKKLGFDLILLGMIASGKDTQAKALEKKYILKRVETGLYTRKLVKEMKGKKADWARRTAGKGKPLPVPLLKEFLIRETKKISKNENILFLGGPRLKPEAQLLKKILENKKRDFLAIYITLPDKEIYKRSLERKDSKMKDIYKIWDNKKQIAIRIKWHKEQVGKTVKYLEKLGKLKKINGNQSVQKVTKDILKEIEKYRG